MNRRTGLRVAQYRFTCLLFIRFRWSADCHPCGSPHYLPCTDGPAMLFPDSDRSPTSSPLPQFTLRQFTLRRFALPLLLAGWATAWSAAAAAEPPTAADPPAAAADPAAESQAAGLPLTRPLRLPPQPGNPRNSEGDFIQLNDGRLLFVYTHFTGGPSDFATAHLAGRFSADGGQTWTDEDTLVLPNNAGMNTMSVSLLRLDNGQIALFCLAKQSIDDCRPTVRFSDDEGASWSDPVMCIATPGYNVLNNDRVVQLDSGRLAFAVALHANRGNQFSGMGEIYFHFSDDRGHHWQTVGPIARGDAYLQEPGLIELNDGRLMIFCRTPHGSQFVSFSGDQGASWSEFQPSSIISPLSPATIERIPSTGDLLIAWNNHDQIAASYRGLRSPFHVAISRDEGKTWENIKLLEDDLYGWYCYTAMEFVGDHVLLAHCAGDRRREGLDTTQITRFPISWLYQADE